MKFALSILVEYKPWFIAFAVAVLFLLLRKIFSKYIFNFVVRLTHKTKTDLDTVIWIAFQKPMRSLIVVVGFYLALNILPIASQNYHVIVDRVFRSLLVLLVSWGIFNLTSSSSTTMRNLFDKMDFQVDRIVLPLINRISRVIVVILALSMIAEEWGYNMTSLMAGIGLGGLAFALAAKDVIANFFGGLVIVTEKPFTLGDWIQTPTVNGSVEDINFRSTKIRTFDRGLVTLPNSVLVNEAITNWNKMDKRRITFNIGLTYDTPRATLEGCARKIEKMLENHPQIDKETIFVRFDAFGPSSLDIFLYFFTKTTNWAEWLAVKEDCNLKIMEIVEGEGAKFAFPSTSLYVESLPNAALGGAMAPTPGGAMAPQAPPMPQSNAANVETPESSAASAELPHSSQGTKTASGSLENMPVASPAKTRNVSL